MLNILLAFLISSFSWSAQALSLSPQMGVHEAASLAGHLAALPESGGKWAIEDVVAADQHGRFEPLPGFLGAGYTSTTYWLRFTLERSADAPAQWYVEVDPPYLDDVTLFVPNTQGGFEATPLGDWRPYAERAVPHRHFVFPLQLPADQPQTLYLRVKTTSTMLVRVSAWQYTGLLASAQVDTSFYSVYFGVLGLGLLSNLVFWFWLRERLYLSYCAYLALLAGTMLTVGGFASQWLFPNQPLLADRLVGVTASLTYLTGTHFFAAVLRLREHFVRSRRVLDAVMLFYAVCAVAAAFGLYEVVVPWLMRLVFVVSTGVALAGPWLLWRGHREYLFYTLAFSANFVAAALTVGKLMGWWSVSMSTDYITVLGAAIHIVLLNFAVVDRVRVSELKMRAAVKHAAELAAERDAVQQQRKFVAMVSHEFRTPLAVIDATAQSVEIACSQARTIPYEFVAPRQEKIRRAVRRMVALLDNFLTSERLDVHISQGEGQKVDLRDLASDAVKSWAHLLQAPEQLQLEVGKTPVPVRVDSAMVKLALSNLIDNAIKYSPLGQPMTLRVGKTPEAGWVEVEDGGVGVSAGEIDAIFEKFYRGSRDVQNVPGVGLGLYLVRTIAHAHGGEVEVQSTPGKGSRFRLRLPLVKP